MGVVYEAVNEAIERRVAIKVLHREYAQDPATASRFFDEARAVNRIEHPSLVQISDYGQTPDGMAYLVMEFLRGESLGQRLDRTRAAGKRLAPGEVARIAWQTADALRAAHEKNVVHRDLKPDNLMLVRDPIAPGGERVKVLDFGIAKLMATKAKRTATNAVMGTPLYMSPEQCRGDDALTDKSDVYSLGVMMYEMVAGKPPFDNAAGGMIMASHIFRDPAPLRALPNPPPEGVAQLISDMMAKEPAQRPTMAQAVARLESLGVNPSMPALRLPTGGFALAPRMSGPQPMTRPSQDQPTQPVADEQVARRRRLLLVVGLPAIFAVAVGTALLLQRPEPVRPNPTQVMNPPSVAPVKPPTPVKAADPDPALAAVKPVAKDPVTQPAPPTTPPSAAPSRSVPDRTRTRHGTRPGRTLKVDGGKPGKVGKNPQGKPGQQGKKNVDFID